ncbi:MAG: HEAT repeat domain-containing protein [Planctomycetes bacterium]|nr:HEAT repeat domain-containing protein [Planctomycetota bacterium]
MLLLLAGGIGVYYWHWRATAVDRKTRDLIYECAGWPDSSLQKRLKGWKLEFLLKDKPAPRDEDQIKKEFMELGPAAIPGLLSLLEDEDDNVRFNAVYTIAEFGEKDWRFCRLDSFFNLVLKHCGDDRTNIKQEPIIFADARSVEPLIKVLLNDKLEEIRTEAAIVLGKLGDSRAVEPLAAAMLHDPGSIGDVRVEAARALGKIRDSKAIDALIQVLQGVTLEPSWIPKGTYLYSEVDIEVIKALGNFKDARVVDLLIKKIGEIKSMTNTTTRL